MQSFQRALTEIVGAALLGFALISVTAATKAGNAPSDSEQTRSTCVTLPFTCKAPLLWSQGSTRRPARRMGRTFRRAGLRGHVAEAEWPLGRDRQRISLSDP